MEPVLSVVMTVFNGERFLAEAMDSILAQTFEDFEFIVIDDGSAAPAAAMLDAYARRDARIRLIHQANRGQVPSLISGCAMARGRYLARMDADDIAMPERFRKQVNFLEANPAAVLLGSEIHTIREDGSVSSRVTLPHSHEEIAAAMLTHNCLYHSAVMMRRPVYQEAGGYRVAVRTCEDFDLWLRMAERGRVANLPEALVHYRWHGDQISVRHVRQQCYSSLAAKRSAQIRREGGADPIQGDQAVTAADLERMGLPSAEIHRAYLTDLVYKAQMLEGLGMEGEVAGLWQLAQGELAPAGADAKTRALVHWNLARWRYRSGAFLRSLGAALRASWLQPRLPAGALKRRLRAL